VSFRSSCEPHSRQLQYKEKGDESELHIIIFDELDAIFKQRGSTNSGTGVGDTVVNQLLSKVWNIPRLHCAVLIYVRWMVWMR
jgi:vesicle-fusing ATPase